MTRIKHGRNGFSKKRNKKYSNIGYVEKREEEKEIVKKEERKKITIRTHQGVDLDAICSVWLEMRFIHPNSECKLIFVPASYDGNDMGDDDIAVDIEAGGRGIKGSVDKEGFHHSSFYTIFKKAHLPADIHQALFPLVNIIDKKDVYGKVALAPNSDRLDEGKSDSMETIRAMSLSLKGFQTKYENNDDKVCQVMFDLIDGLFKQIFDSKPARIEVERKSFSCGYVFVVETSKKFSTSKNVFNNPNNKVYIYVNPQKNYMGVYLSDSLYYQDGFRLRMEDVKKIIEKFGEKIGKGGNEWFLHENGFLLAWGTRKDARESPSKIRPEELAWEINQLILNFYKLKNKIK